MITEVKMGHYGGKTMTQMEHIRYTSPYYIKKIFITILLNCYNDLK